MADRQEILKQCIGERIKNLRVEAGYTSQETFAYDAQISRPLYGRYEKGTNITVKNLLRVVDFHKMSLADFFSEGFDALDEDSESNL